MLCRVICHERSLYNSYANIYFGHMNELNSMNSYSKLRLECRLENCGCFVSTLVSYRLIVFSVVGTCVSIESNSKAWINQNIKIHNYLPLWLNYLLWWSPRSQIFNHRFCLRARVLCHIQVLTICPKCCRVHLAKYILKRKKNSLDLDWNEVWIPLVIIGYRLSDICRPHQISICWITGRSRVWIKRFGP